MSHNYEFYNEQLNRAVPDENALKDFFSEDWRDQCNFLMNYANWQTLINLYHYKPVELEAILGKLGLPEIFKRATFINIPANNTDAVIELIAKISKNEKIAEAILTNNQLCQNIKLLLQHYKPSLLKIASNKAFFEKFSRNLQLYIEPQTIALSIQEAEQCPWIIFRIPQKEDFENFTTNSLTIFNEAVNNFEQFHSEIQAFSLLAKARKEHGFSTLFSISPVSAFSYIKTFLNYAQESELFTKAELNNPPIIEAAKKIAIINYILNAFGFDQFVALKIVAALIEPALYDQIQDSVIKNLYYQCKKQNIQYPFKLQLNKPLVNHSNIELSIAFKKSHLDFIINNKSPLKNNDIEELFTENELKFESAQKAELDLKHYYLTQLSSEGKIEQAIAFIRKQPKESILHEQLPIYYQKYIEHLLQSKNYAQISQYADDNLSPYNKIAYDSLKEYMYSLKSAKKFSELLQLHAVLPKNLQSIIDLKQLCHDFINYSLSVNDFSQAIAFFNSLTNDQRPFECDEFHQLMIENFTTKHLFKDAIKYIQNNLTKETVRSPLFYVYHTEVLHSIDSSVKSTNIFDSVSTYERNIGSAAGYFLRGEVYRLADKNYLDAYKVYNTALTKEADSRDDFIIEMHTKARIEIANMFINGLLSYDLETNDGKLIVMGPGYDTNLPAKGTPEYQQNILNKYIPAFEYIESLKDSEAKQLKQVVMNELLGKAYLAKEHVSEYDFFTSMAPITLAQFLYYYKNKNPNLYQKAKAYLKTFALTQKETIENLNKTVATQGEQIKELAADNKSLREKFESSQKDNLEQHAKTQAILQQLMSQLEPLMKKVKVDAATQHSSPFFNPS